MALLGKISRSCIPKVRKGCSARKTLVASSSHGLEGLAVPLKVNPVRVREAQGFSHC